MIGDHHGRTAGRATLLVRATDEILGTHRTDLWFVQEGSSMSNGHGAGNGMRLRLARQARGFSQQQLAGMAGVSRQAVSAVESGLSDPSLRVALALAHALGVTVEEMFGLFGPAPPVVARPVAPLGGEGSQGRARADG
jgi:DNA-binding XRE family transcriptional regulator